MTYVIDEKCVDCGICVGECPVEAIVPGKGKHEINEACISCGACAPVCPVNAISPGKSAGKAAHDCKGCKKSCKK